MDRGEGQQWNAAPGNIVQRAAADAVGRRGRDPARVDLGHPAAEGAAPTRSTSSTSACAASCCRSSGGATCSSARTCCCPKDSSRTRTHAIRSSSITATSPPTSATGARRRPIRTSQCEYSERFQLDCYNRIQQQGAYDFYKAWTGPGFPRVLVIEIQHANPYYDDSYAVNSANLGPYGDAIMKELVPHIESRFRGIGAGWARATYGGSTGGWEALAVQMFYPDDFNAAYAACPDPIDFRAFTVVDIYERHQRLLVRRPVHEGAAARTPQLSRPLQATLEQMNRMELVLGTRTRSGQQWDIWEAVYSPQGPDGYPARIWDKRTGVIDKTVAEYWKEHYDLSWILRRDWNRGLGRKLAGKIHLYVGDMDNYYLNNAVYLVEEFLKSAKDPAYGGEVAYGDRAEHCWNGDPTRANAYSRLRYHQMFIPKFVERARRTAPPGADVKSWRY